MNGVYIYHHRHLLQSLYLHLRMKSFQVFLGINIDLCIQKFSDFIVAIFKLDLYLKESTADRCQLVQEQDQAFQESLQADQKKVCYRFG